MREEKLTILKRIQGGVFTSIKKLRSGLDMIVVEFLKNVWRDHDKMV